MGTSPEISRVLKKLESAHRIENRLTHIDWCRDGDGFEEAYEVLLDDFYNHLLDIDELMTADSCAAALLKGRFKALLETGRRLDALWDRYHRDRLALPHFFRLLERTARLGSRLADSLAAALPPNRRHH